MRTYYVYLLDREGHITTRLNVDCDSDAAAVEEAWELMASEHHASAAVWYLDRQVTVLRAGK
jgi:hypothetical protein